MGAGLLDSHINDTVDIKEQQKCLYIIFTSKATISPNNFVHGIFVGQCFYCAGDFLLSCLTQVYTSQ